MSPRVREGGLAGWLGKLVAFAADTGADPTDLEERTGPTGRISDVSEYGDYANSLGRARAVRGLTMAGSTEADVCLGPPAGPAVQRRLPASGLPATGDGHDL